MDWPGKVAERLAGAGVPCAPEVVEELSQQLEQAHADALASGCSAADAEAFALAQMPDPEALRAALPPARRDAEAGRPGWLGDLGRDLRYAGRGLRRSPGFAGTALLLLALAIGANTAIFSLIDAVLLRLLPVPHARELVLLTDPAMQGSMSGTSSGRRAALSYEEYLALRDAIPPFSGVLAAQATVDETMVSWSRPGEGGEEAVQTKLVSSNYFEVLQLRPARGRLLTRAGDDGRDPAPVAVLSYQYWRRRFGADPAIIGRTFRAPGGIFTVVGVAPAGFDGEMVGLAADLYAPLGCDPLLHPGVDRLHDPQNVPTRSMWLDAIGRLRPGATLAQANAAAAIAFRPLAAAQASAAAKPEYRNGLLRQRLELVPAGHGASQLRQQYSGPLFALFGLVGLVLLIAVVNLASLLLARAAVREKEIGVRLVLGAGRGRLMRQLLTESLLLALLGGVAGLGLAMLGSRVLLRLVAGIQPDMFLNLGLDWRVLAFAAALCGLTGLGFGLVPAWRLARLPLHAPVQAATARRFPVLKTLAVAQVAISLVLLVSAGLFYRTLANLQRVPLGFNPDHLGEFEVNGPAAGYREAAAALLYQKALQRVQATPGVTRAAITEDGLFEGDDSGDDIEVPGAPAMHDAGVSLTAVSPGYFATVGMPLILGRDLTEADAGSAVRPMLINQALQRKFFPGRNPLGQPVTIDFSSGPLPFVVVGVVGNAKQNSPRDPLDERAFYDLFNGREYRYLRSVVMVVRTQPDPGASIGPLHTTLQEVDPGLRIRKVDGVPELVDSSLVGDRLVARLSGFLALLSLLMAAFGLYGSMSYAVARRTPEIGLRMALGAQQGAVRGMVLGEIGLLAAVALALGIPASLAAARLIAAQLYQLHPFDPTTLAVSAVVLVSLALLAGYLPARRASRLDPLTALRCE